MLMSNRPRHVDLIVVNPNCREEVYQDLGSLVACEPPLWARLIAGYVKNAGHSVGIIDAEAENIPPEEVARAVSYARPYLVCVVAFGHQPSASTQTMVGARKVLDAIVQLSDTIPTILVGGHVSALPERTLAEESCTFICKGEGPETVLQLLESFKETNGAHASTEIPGLGYREQSKAVINPQLGLLDVKQLQGAVWDILPMSKYTAHTWQCFGDLGSRKPYASIYTSLGCPYRCSFCCINAPFDSNRYRMRNPQDVVAEIVHLNAKYGIRTFKIIDEMFILNERHYTEICDGLIHCGLGPYLNIWAYARIDTIKPKTLDRLRKAGFRWLALGIESGSKHVRDGADKDFKTADISTVVKTIQDAGINVIGNFIFGLPDDYYGSMIDTYELAYDLNCEFANFYSAMAYPGSQLYDQAVQKVWRLPESWSGYSQHSFDCTPLPTEKLTSEQVLRFRDLSFQGYFRSPRYQSMIEKKFGVETLAHIKYMVEKPLRRKILDDDHYQNPNAVQPVRRWD